MKKENAKLLIQDTLLELLLEKDFSKITIMDIVRKAEISRTAYYYHYYNQIEIINDIFDDFFTELQNIVDNAYISPFSNFDNLTLSTIEFFYQKRKLLFSIFSNSIEKEFKQRWRLSWKEQSVKWENKFEFVIDNDIFINDYMFSGHYNIYKNWILNQCIDPKEKIVSVLSDCTSNIIKYHSN